MFIGIQILGLYDYANPTRESESHDNEYRMFIASSKKCIDLFHMRQKMFYFIKGLFNIRCICMYLYVEISLR